MFIRTIVVVMDWRVVNIGDMRTSYVMYFCMALRFRSNEKVAIESRALRD